MRQVYEEGEHALSEHRYVDAEKAFERLKQLSPGTAEIYGRLGLVYFQEGKFGDAVPVLRQALKLKPSLPNTDVLLAMSLSELGRFNEAATGIDKGFKGTGDLALRRMCGLQLLRAFTSLRQDSKAVTVALELDRLLPNDPEILYHTSRIYANYAYLTLQKLSQVAPSSVWRQQAAAEADESQGRREMAISEYRQVLASDPFRLGIHYRIGRVLLSQPNADGSDGRVQALKEFEQELELDPTNANAAYEIAEIYRKQSQFGKAGEFFRKALQTYPDFEEAELGLGAVEIALGQSERALEHLAKAAALNPADDVPYYRLSQAYKALGRAAEQQKALAEFQLLRSKAASGQKSNEDLLRPREVTKQESESSASR